MAGKRGQGHTQVRIYPDWCKGCGICVAFCPAEVFVLGPQGKAVVAKEACCMDCGFCELHCPDFAVSVIPCPQGTSPSHVSSTESPAHKGPEHPQDQAHKEAEHGGQEACS